MGDSNHDHSDSAGRGQPLTRYIAALNPPYSANFCQSLHRRTQSQSPLLSSTVANLQHLHFLVGFFILAQKKFDRNWLNQKCQVLLNALNQISNAIWVQYRLQSRVAEQIDWIILQQYALIAGDTS